MTDRPERRVGEVVGGKYRISRFLAAGGMGAVYEAQHTLVKRRFAVKFLHQELARKRDLLTRFQREAEAAGALESENVAAAVDLGVAPDGSPYIVMEYLVGESLEHLLEREGTLPAERATDIVQQACRGVQAAHAHGIVHRDLKPHNLFMCRREDGTDLVKVLDFGIAKLEVLEQNSAATRTGTVLGTPSYMSPEQARGEKSVGHAADVYALGAILYELLSGKKPHPGESHNAILHHISTQPATALASVTEGVSPELTALVMQALAPLAEVRPESAEAFAQVLSRWATHKSWPAPVIDRTTPAHAEPSSTELAPERPAERVSLAPSLAVASVDREPTRSPRSQWVAMAVGAALVLVLVIVFGQAGASRSGEPRAPSAPVLAAAPKSTEPLRVAPPPEPVPTAQIPAKAPTPAASVARANRAPNADAARTAAPSTRRVPLEPRVLAPREKPNSPAEQAAAPVTFDQKNPYH